MSIMEEVGMDASIVKEVENSLLTEENIQKYLGKLEERSVLIIKEYSKLMAEQIIQEKADRFKKHQAPENDNVIEVEAQVNDLKNIIAYENANVMNKFQSWDAKNEIRENNLENKLHMIPGLIEKH